MAGQKTIAEISVDARLLYQTLIAAAEGDVLTYVDLSRIVGRDVSPGNSGYGALHTARHRAQADNHVIFDAVPRIGIKRLSDVEIVGTGQQAVDRVRRAARRGAAKLLSVRDFAALPNDLKIKHNAFASLLGAITQITHSKKVGQLEHHVGNAQASLPLAKTLEIFKL